MTRTTAPRFVALTVLAAIPQAGCSSNTGEFPSLAIRDAERAEGTFEPATPSAPPLAIISPPPGAALLDRLAQLRAEAMSAQVAFADAAPSATRRVSSGGKAAIGSDSWADAQVALANLESIRSRTAVPLGALDILFVDAEIEGAEAARKIAAIAELRETVTAIAARQDRELANLRSRMRQ